MPGLNVGFASAANALTAIQQAIAAVQNNTLNASTPGYAAENVSFSAQSFDPAQGLLGGVDVTLSSTRDQYLEQSVRAESSALGLQEQKSPLLSTLQSIFSVSGDSGIPGALSGFASSFAALSENPNDASAQAGGLQAASTLAQAFNQAAAAISQVATEATQQASSTVTQINALTTHIASLNTAIQRGAQNDAGVAADLNNSLDGLSQLVNISVTNNPDGSATVLLDGQTPLVLGGKAFSLTVKNNLRDAAAPYPNGDAGIILVAQSGSDVTAQAMQGKLGAALQIRNQTVPDYLGGQNKEGQLNDLAKSFASRINAIVTDAQASSGSTVLPLFTYDLTDDTQVASSLTVGDITADQIVAGDGTTSNAVATEIANITNPTNPADLMSNGQSFTAFYGTIAGKAGVDATTAASDLQTQQDLTTQAENQRTQASGVSLDAQAAQLLSLQQAYQATAKIVTILESLSQTVVNLIPQT